MDTLSLTKEARIYNGSQTAVYKNLCDLNNIGKYGDRIPPGLLDSFTFDSDSMEVNINPVGRMKLVITERAEPKHIKFQTESAPLDCKMWIQLKEHTPQTCLMKLTVKAEMTPLVKMMAGNRIEDGIEKMADMLSKIPYDQNME